MTKFFGNNASVDVGLGSDESSAVFGFTSWRNYYIHEITATHYVIVFGSSCAVGLKRICGIIDVHYGVARVIRRIE